MKKLFVLMVLVVAMVAAPLFAEITEDGWAGDFTYKMGGDFTNFADATSNDMDLSMSASVGEFTTFSVGIEAKPGANMAFNTVEMTQDLAGIIGLGFDLSMTVGNFDWNPTEYNNVYEWDFDGMPGDDSFKFVAGFGDIDVTLFMSPVQVVDMMAQFGGEVVYATDAVSVAASYVRDMDTEDGTVAANAKAAVADGTVFVQGDYDLDDSETQVLAGVSYDLSPLSVGVDFGGTADSDTADKVEFSDSMFVALGVDYAVTDDITVMAGGLIPLKETADMFVVDAAVEMKVDTVGYKLGFSYGAEKSTSDWTYAAPYSCNDSAGATFAEDYAISFQMDVDF